MKEIIFVHLLNDYSGSPKVLSQVINAVKPKIKSPILYTGKNSSGFLTHSTEKHYDYFYKRFNNRFATLFSFIISQLILFIKLLKYWNKDVAIYVNTMLPFGAALAGFIMRKPVYYHVHEISMTPASLKYFLRSIIQLTASKIIYVSKAVKEAEPFKTKETHIIYNALPKPIITNGAVHKYVHTPNGQFKVLMVGSLKIYKGILEFIAIANKLEQYKTIQFTLVLNASKEEIESFLELNKIKLPPNIRLLPRQENMVPFYTHTSLVLNLSRIDQWVETFGLTIIEAMAFAIPVIVPPVGGPAEIVTHAVEGYLMSSYEGDAISEKILDLSLDKEKCEKLSENAFNRSKDFDENLFNQKILQVINE